MENYKFIEKLGRGTHGTVYLLKSYDEDKYVVCKSVMEKYCIHAQKEINILSKFNHRRIVRLFDSVYVNTSIFIILEYANYGTLEKMIQYFTRNNVRPSTSLAWSAISQISDALYYLHSKKIIHRDIKPANILINKFWVRDSEYLEFKLCDFSLSTSMEEYGKAIDDGATIGTPFYMAPEIVSKQKYGPSIDVWGLGVVLYEILNLRKPFTGANRKELYDAILTKNVSREEICEDNALSELVYTCLAKKDRVGAKCIAKSEKVRLNLTMLELKYRESRIELLENKIKEFEKVGLQVNGINRKDVL